MKKLLLLLLVTTTSCAVAQQSFFGIAAGANIASQRRTGFPGGTVQFFDNTVQSATGVFYHRGFVHGIGARLGASYWQLGYRGLNINYFTIPLSLYYRLNNYMSVSGGPYLSFTVDNSSINTFYSPQSITSLYHKNDTGFILGMEFDIYKSVALGVNYIIGTKNIWLNDHNGSYTYNNRALQLTLIYKFALSNPKP